MPSKQVFPPTPKKKSSLSNGETTIYYNNKIFWPDNLIEVIESTKVKTRQRFAASKDESAPLVTLELATSSRDVDSPVPWILDWQILSYTENEITFKVYFENAIAVS